VAPFHEPVDAIAVDAEALRGWTRDVVRRLSTPADIADDVADVLVAADLRGIVSHGTFRLPVYAALAEAGVIATSARPVHDGGTRVLSRWDAADGWGPHAGRLLMDDAIERAGSLGMAGSIAHRASHFGIAGWYSMRAAARGLIGLTLTNASPLVAPTRSREKLVGTNPIAVAAPAGRFGMFVLDMATSAVTWGRAIVADRRGEQMPSGVAIDVEGRPTNVPSEVLRGGALLPLGGDEETAGYKGYGLGLMVDVLTGVLVGANFGSRVIPFSTTQGASNLGQLFVAIDPASLEDGFSERMEAMCEALVTAPLAPGARGAVLIPGQPEAEREDEQRRHGIRLELGHHDALVKLGVHVGTPFPAGRPSGRDVNLRRPRDRGSSVA
jgi:L-2-hydroxycarboxylate dehydrogenase (NAD+)